MKTENNRKLPNFIVIGAPKSGTTSLFFYLKQHPEIYLPIRKELHYFSYPLLEQRVSGPGDSNVLASLCSSRQEYESHYKGVRQQRAIGEISPSYLYFSEVSERIKAELGEVKIIALVRNPVEKAYSQYMHMVRENRETLSFYDALMEEENRRIAGWGDIWSYAESSLYAERLEKYISVFGRSNVKIILAEDMFSNPNEALHKLFSFLGVEPSFQPNTTKSYNRTGQPRSKLLADFLARSSLLKHFFKQLIPEDTRVHLRLALMEINTGKKDTMDSKSRRYLTEFFKDDISTVETIIERKTNWILAINR